MKRYAWILIVLLMIAGKNPPEGPTEWYDGPGGGGAGFYFPVNVQAVEISPQTAPPHAMVTVAWNGQPGCACIQPLDMGARVKGRTITMKVEELSCGGGMAFAEPVCEINYPTPVLKPGKKYTLTVNGHKVKFRMPK